MAAESDRMTPGRPAPAEDDPAARSDPRLADAPGVATACEGVVLLDGPDSLAATMTAEAAQTTAERLSRAAREAVAQMNSARAAKDRDEGETAQ